MKTINDLTTLGPVLTREQLAGVSGGVISIINAWPSKLEGVTQA